MAEARYIEVPVSYEFIKEGWPCFGALDRWLDTFGDLEYVRHWFGPGYLETQFLVVDDASR